MTAVKVAVPFTALTEAPARVPAVAVAQLDAVYAVNVMLSFASVSEVRTRLLFASVIFTIG